MHYLQETDMVLHVCHSAHLFTLPAKLCQLLLQPVDLPLSPAA